MLSPDKRVIYCTKRQKIYYELKRISEGKESRPYLSTAGLPVSQQQVTTSTIATDATPMNSSTLLPSPSSSSSKSSYQKLLYSTSQEPCVIAKEDIQELSLIQELSPKLNIAMKCIYCLLVTYYYIVIQPLLEKYFENLSQQRNILFRRTASSEYPENEEQEIGIFDNDVRILETSNLPNSSSYLHRQIQHELEEAFFDQLPYFWTLSLLKKRKLIQFWLKFHHHLSIHSIQLKTCLHQFSWFQFTTSVLRNCNAADVAFCLNVISEDEYFLQKSQLFPHAIYRALSRQTNCQLFVANSNPHNPNTLIELNRSGSGHITSLHLHSHLSQKMSQWLVYVLNKVKDGLIQSGKSPDPVNKSLMRSITSPTTVDALTPKHIPSYSKNVMVFISDELINSSSRSFSSFSFCPSETLGEDFNEEDPDACLPKWIRYLRKAISLCHPFDHLHILFPTQIRSEIYNHNSPSERAFPSLLSQDSFLVPSKSSASSHSSITNALQKYSLGNLPMYTLRDIFVTTIGQNSPTLRSPWHLMTTLYQHHLIPYSAHINESSSSTVLCSMIHCFDPLPIDDSTPKEAENDILWTDDHDTMIQTKSTRQCVHLMLSKKLDVCVFSGLFRPHQDFKQYVVFVRDYVQHNQPAVCPAYLYARQLVQWGDVMTLIYPRKRPMENSVDQRDDPYLQSLLTLYRQYGHELQIVEIQNELTLTNNLLNALPSLITSPIDYLIIEEYSYEQFTREETLSKKYLRFLHYAAASHLLLRVDSPKSSKFALKLKFNTALNSPQAQKSRHPQYHRILSTALVEFQYSIIILCQRDQLKGGK